MTCRIGLFLGLLTVALIAEPVTSFGQQFDGDVSNAPAPPEPPAPPLAGTVIPQTELAVAGNSVAVKKGDSSAVPSIRFNGSSNSPGANDPVGRVALNVPAPGKSEVVVAAGESTKAAEPPNDPLVELTARMVENTDTLAVENQELAPADLECCDQPCCPPCRPLIWVAGVEATFLWPDANTNSALFDYQDEFLDTEVSSGSDDEGVDSMMLTPRIWMGIQGCKWGANVRYWHLRGSDGAYDPILENSDEWSHSDFDWDCPPDTGFFSNSELDAYTIDLEATRRFCIHNCAMQASLGVRHGSVKLHDSITGVAHSDESRFMGFARSDRYSRGTGVVMGLYGRKPLFPCSCVHWFYNARWSALWGPTSTSTETFAAVMVDGSSAGSINGAGTYVDDTLFIGEIQLGLEWNYALQCLPANAFFRTAIEYQRWDGGPGSSEAGSFANYTNPGNYTSTASVDTSAGGPQLDLVGLTLGTGLTW